MADLKVFKVVDSNGEFRVVHALTSLDAVCKFVSDSKISELELREKNKFGSWVEYLNSK